LIRTQGVTTVYGETLASPRIAETLAREAGVEVGVLDPIEGLSDETAGQSYLTLMRANLATIQKGSGC
jgi:zinc transport system substrate-binding protein